MPSASSVIILRWNETNKVEPFRNLRKLFHQHSAEEIGVSIHWLYRQDLEQQPYTNTKVTISKHPF